MTAQLMTRMTVSFGNKITKLPMRLLNPFPTSSCFSAVPLIPPSRSTPEAELAHHPLTAHSHLCVSQPKPVTSQQVFAKLSLKTAIKIG